MKAMLLVVLLLVAMSSFAQKHTPAPELTNRSTIPEILEYLNRTGFPQARIGLDVAVTKDVGSWDPNEENSYPSEPLVFSRGFKLVSGAEDCHLLLRNDDVTVYKADQKDLTPIGLKDLTDSQPPYAAEFSVWLETASHDRGKAPARYTRNVEKAKLLGTWRVEFESRGFFTRSIFGVKLPALRPDVMGGKYFETDSTVDFMFDDKQSAERFDAAFRRLIKLCQPRSDKSRWNR